MVTGFDLYLPPRESRDPVLYREGSLPFTEESKARLQDHKVDTVLISAEQQGLYNRYIESALGDILEDYTIPIAKRAQVLYTSAQSLVKEVLEDPRAGGLVGRSEEMVKHTVGFLYRESESFPLLMKLTSFDYYTYTHSVNVFVFTTSLAQRLGYSEDDAHEVILDVVRHHHEKLDGSGYPDGLKGDEIYKWSRMCAVCDIFDAMTTRRSYKDALPSFPALALMRDQMSKQIDMEYFKTFVGLVGRQ